MQFDFFQVKEKNPSPSAFLNPHPIMTRFPHFDQLIHVISYPGYPGNSCFSTFLSLIPHPPPLILILATTKLPVMIMLKGKGEAKTPSPGQIIQFILLHSSTSVRNSVEWVKSCKMILTFPLAHFMLPCKFLVIVFNDCIVLY